jgi:hypothetical protein
MLASPNGKCLGPSYKELEWDSKLDAESDFELESIIREIRVGSYIMSHDILLVSRSAVVVETA